MSARFSAKRRKSSGLASITDGELASLRKRVDAYKAADPAIGPDDEVVPTAWTPEWVTQRMTEAYEVLSRTPVQIWPKGFSNAWPAYVHDDEDRKQQEVLRRRPQPTLDEYSRAEEALFWCFEYLQRYPMQADGLQLYCWCRAYGVSIARMLGARREVADRRIEEVTDNEIAASLHERNKVISPKVAVRQKTEEAMRKERRTALAREVAKWANARLAHAREPQQRANIKANAKIRFEREIKRLDAAAIRVTRQDVMPGRVFTKRWLDVCRKQAAARISDELNKARVRVR